MIANIKISKYGNPFCILINISLLKLVMTIILIKNKINIYYYNFSLYKNTL